MSHQDVEDEEAAEQQGFVYDHDWDPEADILDGEPGERESGDRREGDDDQRSCANCSRPILWSSACAFCPGPELGTPPGSPPPSLGTLPGSPPPSPPSLGTPPGSPPPLLGTAMAVPATVTVTLTVTVPEDAQPGAVSA